MDVIVVVDFEGQLGDELTVKAGDIIKNVKPSGESGWLFGELNGKKGCFPRHFVQEIPASFSCGLNRNPRSLRKSSLVKKKKQRWCEAQFLYTPTKGDELEIKVGDIIEVLQEIEDGWWLGKLNDVTGAFPSNFVKELSSDKIPVTLNHGHAPINSTPKQRQQPSETAPDIIKDSDKSNLSPGSTENGDTQGVKEYCKAMFDFGASADDELDLKKGDTILVINKVTEDEGWWEGEKDGKRGFFPDNFVILLTSEANASTKPLPPRTLSIKKTEESNEQKKEQSPKSSVQPAKKPPPPPGKSKLIQSLSFKHNGELHPIVPKPTVTEPAKDRHNETEVDGLDCVQVSSEKLSHPTANRPKPQGRRPPTNLHSPPPVAEKSAAAPFTVKGIGAQVLPPLLSPTSKKAGCPVKRTPSNIIAEAKPKSETETTDKTLLEELKAEIQEMKFALELVKNQHQKDVAELKHEITEERTKRMSLQAEVEKIRKLLPS
ncbi:CD2-associated protein-like isoform X2 [Protopterus annectens]|uniref:CD2-associated protein-like isoform X2 n=1 Tax=Protopterus annectens TaxID=7888 RepID=UPI001CF9A38C|nr:CD2-associated protein-like isoform X2 [Protopterus annectens]